MSSENKIRPWSKAQVETQELSKSSKLILRNVNAVIVGSFRIYDARENRIYAYVES